MRARRGRSRYAHGFLTRWRLSLVLEQLQKPLSAPPRELPRGQPSSWETGAHLDKGGRRCVLGARLVRVLLTAHVIARLIRHVTPPALH
jgi:hypothetical protein